MYDVFSKISVVSHDRIYQAFPHFSYSKRQNWAWRPGKKARFSTYDLQTKAARAWEQGPVWTMLFLTCGYCLFKYIATLATEYSTEWNLHLDQFHLWPWLKSSAHAASNL